jgi:hypothetical protein
MVPWAPRPRGGVHLTERAQVQATATCLLYAPGDELYPRGMLLALAKAKQSMVAMFESKFLTPAQDLRKAFHCHPAQPEALAHLRLTQETTTWASAGHPQS